MAKAITTKKAPAKVTKPGVKKAVAKKKDEKPADHVRQKPVYFNQFHVDELLEYTGTKNLTAATIELYKQATGKTIRVLRASKA